LVGRNVGLPYVSTNLQDTKHGIIGIAMTPPKVFLSHATEDKLRFVNDFALRLRSNGIDAWLDKWEILPGDSLIDKIFEEGLKEADAVIIVLSANSVLKPWVREELNSSVVAKIQKGTRLIPIVIDKCEVPEALKVTAWEIINDISNYDDNFDRILASIFGKSIKPELGQPPAYVSAVLKNINGIEAIDNLILKRSCEYLLEKPYSLIEPKNLFGENDLVAPPTAEIVDSINILENKGYFSVSRFLGGNFYFQATLLGFEEYCKAYVPNYGTIVDKCAGLIVNNEVRTNFDLQDTLGIPRMLANHVIRRLKNDGYVKVSEEMSGRIAIYEVSTALRRALR
jgi:hypothetical protein